MRFPSRPNALATLVLVLALLAAACGSGDDTTEAPSEDSGTGDTTATEDDIADDGDAAAEVTDGSDAATSGLAEGDAGDEATSEVLGTAGADDFCGLFSANQDLLNEFDFFDPAQVEEWFAMSRSLLDEAIDKAPDEVRSDLEIIRADYDPLLEALEANDFDFFAASDAIDALETPEADAASDRIDAYVEAACGIDPDQSSEDFAEDLLENDLDSILDNPALLDSVVEGMIADGDFTQEQATCVLQNLDPELLAGLAGGDIGALSDPTVLQNLLDVLEGCGIDLAALAG